MTELETILTRENDELRARVEELEAALYAEDVDVPLEWALTGSERRVFGVLLARAIATKEAVMAALYHDFAADAAEVKIVDVYVCKIRAKLRKHGVRIETVWGLGYRLDEAQRASLLAKRKAAA